jgi:hypothetical protein
MPSANVTVPVKAVHDHGGVGQCPVDGGAEGGAQIDRDIPHLRVPGFGLGGEPGGGTAGVAALDLPEEPLPADRVDEADMPGVGDKFPLVRVGVLPPDGLAAPGLVDPDRLGFRRRPGQHPGCVGFEAVPHDRPGQAQVTAGPHDGAPAVAHRGPGLPPQPRGGAHPGRNLAYLLGERAPLTAVFGAVPARLAPADGYRASAAGQMPRPGDPVLLQLPGEHPAGRAGPRGGLGGDHVHHRTARPVVRDLHHTHPLQPQQLCRRRVDLGIVSVQARGFS